MNADASTADSDAAKKKEEEEKATKKEEKEDPKDGEKNALGADAPQL
jgi:hypothetical protein